MFAKCLVDVQKNCKLGISAHKENKKLYLEGLLSGPSRGYYLVRVGCVKKKRKLGPDNNP